MRMNVLFLLGKPLVRRGGDIDIYNLLNLNFELQLFVLRKKFLGWRVLTELPSINEAFI